MSDILCRLQLDILHSGDQRLEDCVGQQTGTVSGSEKKRRGTVFPGWGVGEKSQGRGLRLGTGT